MESCSTVLSSSSKSTYVITIFSCLSKNNMRQETVSFFIYIPPQDTEDYRYFDPKLLRVTDR